MFKLLQNLIFKFDKFFSLMLMYGKKLGNMGVIINTILILYVSFFFSIYIYYEVLKKVFKWLFISLNIYICFVERVRIKVKVIREKLEIGYTYLTFQFKYIFFRLKYFFIINPNYLYYIFLICLFFFFKIYLYDFSSAETENFNENTKIEKEVSINDLEKDDLEKEKKSEKIKTFIFYSIIIIIIGLLIKHNYDLASQITELKEEVSQLTTFNDNVKEEVSQLIKSNNNELLQNISNVVSQNNDILKEVSKISNSNIDACKDILSLQSSNKDLHNYIDQVKGITDGICEMVLKYEKNNIFTINKANKAMVLAFDSYETVNKFSDQLFGVVTDVNKLKEIIKNKD